MATQGTVLTGTIVRGAVSVGQSVEITALGVQKKVKSIQMFRQPVLRASQASEPPAICLYNWTEALGQNRRFAVKNRDTN